MNNVILSPKKLILLITFLVSIFAYIWYVKVTYANIVFEVAYDHFPFIESIISGTPSWRTFFTIVGEHIVAGYNPILVFNWFVFDLTNLVDAVISVACSAIIALLFMYYVSSSEQQHSWLEAIATTLSCLVLLSFTTPQAMSMTLAAQVGTVLMIIIAIGADSSVGRATTPPVSILICMVAATLLFLGGYSAGLIIALSVVGIALLVGKHSYYGITFILTALILSLSYILILEEFSYVVILDLFRTGNTSYIKYVFDPLASLEFASIMTGASLLGSAYFEQGGPIGVYVVVGSFLLITALIMISFLFYRQIKGDQKRGDVFLLFIMVYSAGNILTVSITRLMNGVDGGLGFWYNQHVKFLPACILIVAARYSNLLPGNILKKIAICSVFLVVAVPTIVGDLYEARKAPYVKPWKESFLQTIPDILNDSLSATDRKNPYKTLLMDYDTTRKALLLMQAHRKWIFSAQPKNQ